MTYYENIKPNRTQAIGLLFLVISVFTVAGGWSFVSAYWDTTLVENYRGYDIYTFPEISFIHGIDTGGLPKEWVHVGSLENARNKIDLWVDGPLNIGTYRDFTVYQLQGTEVVYAKNGVNITPNHIGQESLEAYIDAVYYPTRVSTMHEGQDDYYIFRQGADGSPVDLHYWVVLDGITLEYFDKLGVARAYIRARAATTEEPATEEPENSGTPDLEEPIPEGDYSITDNVVDAITDVINYVTGASTSATVSSEGQRTETIGAFMVERQTMITALTGSLGAGLMVLGSIKRDEK